MIKGLSETHLPVNDIDRSIDFTSLLAFGTKLDKGIQMSSKG